MNMRNRINNSLKILDKTLFIAFIVKYDKIIYLFIYCFMVHQHPIVI